MYTVVSFKDNFTNIHIHEPRYVILAYTLSIIKQKMKRIHINIFKKILVDCKKHITLNTNKENKNLNWLNIN